MRSILAIVWGVLVFVAVAGLVNLCAIVKYPPGDTSGLVMRVAGVVIGLGLGASAYLKTAKPPAPPPP